MVLLEMFCSVLSFLPKYKVSKTRPSFSSLASAFGNTRGHCKNETIDMVGGNFLSPKLSYVYECFISVYVCVLHMCLVPLEALELVVTDDL